jgi:hypothetical protein
MVNISVTFCNVNKDLKLKLSLMDGYFNRIAKGEIRAHNINLYLEVKLLIKRNCTLIE